MQQASHTGYPDLEGKMYKFTGRAIHNHGVVTYYKFGKIYEKTGYYKTITAKVSSTNLMIKAGTLDYPAYNIEDILAKLTEVTPTEFYYIMRDAIDNYTRKTKESLGITETEPGL